MAKKAARRKTTEPRFVFRGTIQKLNATTMSHVPSTSGLAVVSVDEVLHAPPALARTLGQSITVKLSKTSGVRVGQQLLFYANAWLMGDGVAVESVREQSAADTPKALAARGTEPTQNLANRDVENRYNNADLVVQGQVVSVDVPQVLRASHRAAIRAGVRSAVRTTGTTDDVRPVSEHDPKWRDATIEVAAVHKGQRGKRTIKVRFPSSTDVRWYRAPKFHPGDQGVWMLKKQHTEPVSAGALKKAQRTAVAAPATSTEEVFTALNPLDFHPSNHLDAVAPLLNKPQPNVG